VTLHTGGTSIREFGRRRLTSGGKEENEKEAAAAYSGDDTEHDRFGTGTKDISDTTEN
jgi:hypothetical protein